MRGITTEVHHYIQGDKLMCVTIVYQNGEFIADSRHDVTDQVGQALTGNLNAIEIKTI